MRSVVVLIVLVLCGSAHAQGALDKPSFTATPAELLAAAKAAPTGSDIVVLREDQELVVDDKGRMRSRWRMVVALLTQAGADEWRTVGASWNPTYQDKPTLRARVVDATGKGVDVDPALIRDEPPDGDEVVRSVRMPLPRLAVGTVVEQEVAIPDRIALPGGGGLRFLALGNDAPTLTTRVTVSAPAKARVHVTARGLGKVQPKLSSAAGKQTWRYDIAKLSPNPQSDWGVPPDVITYVGVGVSAAASWGSVATDYAAIVDTAIAVGPVPMPVKLPTTPTIDTVRAITHWVNGILEFRYDGFSESAMSPASPADTLKRGRADANDKP